MKNALLSLLCMIGLLAFGQESVQTAERSIITKDQINTYKLSADRWLVRFESGVSESRKDQLLYNTGIVGAIEHLPSPEVSLIRVQSQNSEKQILNTLQALPQVLYAARGMVFGDGTNEFPLDRVFVQLKDGRQRGYLSQKAAQFGYEEAGESFMPDLMELVFHKNSTLDPVAFSNMLQGEGVVDWSEPDMLKLLKKMTTNDNLINYQWSLNNTGSSIQYNGTPGEDMSVFNAWNGTTGKPSIKVAILDEGVDLDHPDLLANMLPGFDGHGITAGDAINDDAHGTACAGIVAAVGNNNIGTAGVAYGSKIIPVRIAYSSGSSWVTSNSIIGNSITWSWQTAGADILSNSWGGGGSSSLINSPISNAVNSGRSGKGAPVLFAAGNDNSAVSYPATLSDVISVAAMSMCGERKNPSSCDGETWWGSNYGTGLDVAAPGVKIAATDIAGSNGYSTGDYTGSFNGTSSACPNAAGVMALILSADRTLTETNARDILESTCDKAGGYTYTSGNPNGTWSNELGYGRVNAQAAVQSALASTACPFNSQIGVSGVTSTTATIFMLTANTATRNYLIEYGPQGFSIGTGTFISKTAVGNDTTVISGLNPLTAYSFKYYRVCGTDTSLAKNGPDFTTACGGNSCTYTINMTDSYGDGWNGAVIGIYQNGTLISTFGNGFTPLAVQNQPPSPLCDGFTADLIAESAGNWPTEIGFTILDAVNGNPIFGRSSGSSFATGNNLGSFAVNCSSNPCVAPTNLNVLSTTSSDATIYWDGGSSTGWKVEYGAVGFSLSTGTTVQAINDTTTLTGLNASTSYDVYVQADCGSSWIGPITATTLCAPDSLPYSTDFTTAAVGAATDFGNCWTAQTSNGYEWHGEDATGSNENSVNTGPFYDNTSFGQAGGVYLYAEASSPAVAGDKAYLMSPEIDLAQSSHPKMTFHYHMYGVNTGTLEVEISDNGGSGWQSLYSISGEQQSSGASAWNSKSLDLTGFTGVVQVRFVATRGAGYEGDICLDDISIQNDPPSCAAPINLNVLNTTSNSALLTWTDLNSAQIFKVEYGQTGFTRGGGTTVTASNDTFDLLGLNSSTDYEFYVQSECSWGPSAWSGPLSFKTLSSGGTSFQRFCSVIDSVAEINFNQGVYRAYFDSLRFGEKYRIRWAPVVSQSQSSIIIDSTVIRSKVFSKRTQPYMNINITPWYNSTVLVWLESDTLDGQGEVWANPQACTLDRNGQVFQLLNKGGGGGVILGSVIDGNIVQLPVGCKAQTLSLVVQRTASCAEDSVLLRAGYAGGTGSPSYLWSNGATTKRTYADQGETLSITITDAAGCSITDSITAPTVDTTAVPGNWTLTKNNATTFTGSFTAPALPAGSTLIGYRMAYRLRNTQTWTNTPLSQNTSITHDFTGSGLPGGNYEFVAFTRYRDANLNAVNSNFTCRLVKGYNGSGNKSGSAGSNGSDANAYAIYPNPANDLLHVSAGSGSLIRLLDVRGRLIAQEEVHQSEVQFEIGHLTRGVYMVQVIMEPMYTQKKSSRIDLDLT